MIGRFEWGYGAPCIQKAFCVLLRAWSNLPIHNLSFLRNEAITIRVRGSCGCPFLWYWDLLCTVGSGTCMLAALSGSRLWELCIDSGKAWKLKPHPCTLFGTGEPLGLGVWRENKLEKQQWDQNPYEVNRGPALTKGIGGNLGNRYRPSFSRLTREVGSAPSRWINLPTRVFPGHLQIP